MRVILRRELIGKTAVMIGTAAAPLLAKAALAQTQADGRSNMSDVRLSSLVKLFTPITRRPTARTRWAYTAG